jgi:hypothetical protein
MSTDDFDTLAPGDEELLAGLHRSVAGAALTAGTADVVALGRRMRNRRRAVAAGIGTSAAAIVAAIGVLAPSAGTGTGGGRDLTIRDAGFTMREHSDGTVFLTVDQAFSPTLLQAALDKAGVPSAVLVEQLPAGWDATRPIQCKDTAAVHAPPMPVSGIGLAVVDGRTEYRITKSAVPAGQFVTLVQFRGRPGTVWDSFGLRTGRQTTCEPEYYPDPKPAA